jgi:hypothetical protein
MPETPDSQVTSADEIIAARRRALPVTLPDSGWVVSIRKTSLLELAAAGRIPDELASAALVSLAEALDEATRQEPAEAKRTMRRRLDLINAVCCAILDSPAMSEDAAEGAIRPDDLPLQDRIHLYGIATGSVKGPSLARFPGGPGPDVAAGEDGEGVGAASVESAGAR